MRKFSMTFPDGSVVEKKPSDALECFVRFVGFDAVAAKNTKLISEPFLTQRPSKDVLKNYRALDDDIKLL